MSVTAYVVFFLALAGLPETALISHRILNTLLGGVIGLMVHAMFSPLEQSWEGRRSLRGPV